MGNKKNSKEISNMVRRLKDQRSILDTLGPDMLVRGMIRDDIRIAVIVTLTEGTRVFWGNTEELVSIANLIMDQQSVLSFQVFDLQPNSRELKAAQC
jgi:hypothetical protein